MTLKFNGKSVPRMGQVLVLGTKPKTKSTKKEKEETMNKEATEIINTLAKGILARDKEQERQLSQLHPAPPPAVLLAKTGTEKEVEDWYAKPETVKTNVNGIHGLESYLPPPCLLAPLTKEEKQ